MLYNSTTDWRTNKSSWACYVFGQRRERVLAFTQKAAAAEAHDNLANNL